MQMPMIKAVKNDNVTTAKMAVAVRAIEEQFPEDVIVIFVVQNREDGETQSLHISSNSSEDDTYTLIQSVAHGIQADGMSEWNGRPN